MGRRTLLAIASVLVATAGTALIWVYVRGADARAHSRWQDLVPVLVATQAIEAGTDAAVVRARTTREQIPRLLAPDGRLADVGPIGTRTVAVPILPGQYVIEAQFDTANAASAVKPGMMAAAFSVDDPDRVASLLRPDSRVAVYGVTTGRSGRRVDLLIADVRVIGVGSTTTLRNAAGGSAKVGTQGGVSTAVVTLEVTGKQATLLKFYQDTLFFTLLGDGARGSASDAYAGPVTAAPANG